jgi:hypothetical protein
MLAGSTTRSVPTALPVSPAENEIPVGESGQGCVVSLGRVFKEIKHRKKSQKQHMCPFRRKIIMASKLI